MKPFFRKMTAALVVLVGALSLASCAGGHSADQPGPPGGAQVSSALKERVQSLLADPTGIGRVTALTHKPSTGKFIVGIETPIATALVTGAGQAAAARLLGWKYEAIQEGTSPEGPAQALAAAIALKPDGIIYYSAPRQSMAADLATAKAAGIPIVTSATPDPNPPTPPVIAQFNNSAPMLAPLGAGIADYVAVDSKLSAHVALVTLPVYKVLQSFDSEFRSQLKADCAHCSITEVPQQLTDLGTVTPASVVNAIRRNPQINYVIFDCGCAATGVSAALQAAGMTSVVIGGEGPLAPSIKELQQGQNEVWAALPLESMGYGLMDTFARYFNGQSLDPIVTQPPRWQILTRGNVATAHFDSQDNYVGYPDYAGAWANLWKAN